jgi:uncharacterized protein YndB with AHSA1/START domain
VITARYSLPLRSPPQVVFDYVTDVERMPEWQNVAGVRKVTRHEPGPLAVGSRFSIERMTRGKVVTLDATVTALDPDRRFDFHTVDDDGFDGDFTTTLEPSGDDTVLRWAVRMQPHKLLYRLLQPLIQQDLRRAVERDFSALRDRLDRTVTS